MGFISLISEKSFLVDDVNFFLIANADLMESLSDFGRRWFICILFCQGTIRICLNLLQFLYELFFHWKWSFCRGCFVCQCGGSG
jgi:hypothetical protein